MDIQIVLGGLMERARAMDPIDRLDTVDMVHEFGSNGRLSPYQIKELSALAEKYDVEQD